MSLAFHLPVPELHPAPDLNEIHLDICAIGRSGSCTDFMHQCLSETFITADCSELPHAINRQRADSLVLSLFYIISPVTKSMKKALGNEACG